jgi:hypothetical protein
MKMKWDGDIVKKAVRDASLDGLFEAAENVLRVSNDRVPHDEGSLQGSGETSVESSKMEATISYGNPTDEYPGVGNQPYAERLHEHPEYHFKKGRQGKFLESAHSDEEDRSLEYIADRLRQVMK